MKKLSIKHILILHELLIKNTGGASGMRDEGLLESAVNTPFETFDSAQLYPTIQQKAARLGFGLVKNHPFVDGNKRIGTLAMLTFLEINGVNLNYTDEELITLGLSLADGSISEKEVLEWIIKHN